MTRLSRKTTAVTLIVILLLTLASGAFSLYKYSQKKPAPSYSGDATAQTTSKAPTAQSTYTGGSERSATTVTPQEATVSDNKGSITTVPPQNTWTKSANGSLVVYTPTANSLLKTGDTISGTSNSNRVAFRLIDNISGVIAQGSISVVNGKFSGTFSFSTKATQGQVDVFDQAYDGTESNNVSIPVRFQ